jgi:hypothetical protein
MKSELSDMKDTADFQDFKKLEKLTKEMESIRESIATSKIADLKELYDQVQLDIEKVQFQHHDKSGR